MLYVGSDDGVYRVAGALQPGETTAERVLATDRPFRLEQFAGLEGLFAAGPGGLHHSTDGDAWTELALSADDAAPYSVAADPSGERLYVGTRPARLFAADCDGGVPADAAAWTELAGFRALGERVDWGLERHGGIGQVRSFCTHPERPDRLVAGVEVGGVHVSDDRGATWATRSIAGFDAPHTDDLHHLAMPGPDALVASTGSGLYRTTDAGRSWERLDGGHRQGYVREAFVHGGTIHAGAAPAPSSTWDDDPDHALFAAPADGAAADVRTVASPTPEEVAVGWTAADGAVLAATHRGTLLARDADGWRATGSVPTPGSVQGRYLPLAWVAG